MLTQTYQDKLSRNITRRWLRPLKVQASEQPPIFEKESLQAPGVEEISQEEAGRHPILEVSTTNGPAEVSGSASIWAYKTQALTPFDPGYVRVISRTANGLSVKRVPIQELKRTLDFQQKNETLRIDAWLPPGDGKFDINAPGKRRILYGHAWDTSWERASGGTLSVSSDQEWKRISVLLVATSDFQNPKTSKVAGNVYW